MHSWYCVIKPLLSEYVKKINLSKVAFSGSYKDLKHIPQITPIALSGSYNDLKDLPDFKPVATSGLYNDLTGIPDLKSVALSGSYNDLTDLPTDFVIKSNLLADLDQLITEFS